MTQEQKRIKIAEVVGKDGDYFNDLNACHEMEKTICGEDFDTPLWISFLCNLDRVVNKRRAHATAAQRAEAFGKTLNFW